MLRALTRKFRMAPDVQLLPVTAACPATASGADLYGLAADAWTIALRRTLAAPANAPRPGRPPPPPQFRVGRDRNVYPCIPAGIAPLALLSCLQ